MIRFRGDRVVRLFALCWLIAAASHRIQARESPPSTAADNAALKYWQAFALLPEWTERQQQIIGEWQTAPLDDDAQAVIDAAGPALLYLQRGAKLATCDWSLDLADGPGLVLPHLSRARELARLGALRARAQFAKGQAASALTDINAGLALARHVGANNLLISVLVQAAIESTFVDLVAEQLPQFDAASLELLAKQLASLPPGGTVKDSMQLERSYFVDWFRGRLDSGGASAANRLPEMKPAIDALGTVAATAMLVRYGKFYQDAERVADLPIGEQQAAFQALERKYADNWIAKTLTPAYSRAFDAENKARVRLAMLQAAIAVQQGGRARLANLPDPCGGGEFTYRERPGGFELESKLNVAGQPVTLVVGPPAAQAGKP